MDKNQITTNTCKGGFSELYEARLRAYQTSYPEIKDFSSLDDGYDDIENCANIYCAHRGELIAGLRTHKAYYPEELYPTRHVFRDECESIIQKFSGVLDHTRFFIDNRFRDKYLEISFQLFGKSLEIVHDNSIEIGLAPVRSGHSGFYKKFLNFEKVGEREIYYPPFSKKHILMFLNYKKNFDEAYKRYPSFFIGK